MASLPTSATNASPDPLLTLTVIGKTAFALALVIGVIFLCAWLARRFGAQRYGGSRWLRVVASQAVGQKERVVVIAVNDTWLVLGVAPGQVSTLHTLPAPPPAPAPPPGLETPREGFAARLAQMMRHEPDSHRREP